MMHKQVLLYKGSFINCKRLELELISNKINPIIVNNKQSAIFYLVLVITQTTTYLFMYLKIK